MKASANRRQPAAEPQRNRAQKSRVTNGALFVVGEATSAYARRFSDILSSVVSDLGGPDQLSEGQRQIARRAASLSLACERLEEALCTGVSSAAEEAFAEASGGLTAYQILNEAGRILHGVARIRGGDGIRQMAALPSDELDRVTDLLTRAADIAAKSISAGSAQSADLELLGTLADRCGRTFMRLGIKRVPREVESLSDYLSRRAAEAPEEVPLEDAVEAADMVSGLPDSANGNGRTSGRENGSVGPSTGEEGAGA
jgi:hypothetical protein